MEIEMRTSILGSALFVAMLAAVPARAADASLGQGHVAAGTGSVVTPYRFSPTPQSHMAPADQQNALAYRMQLQRQTRELETLQSQGKLGAYGTQVLTGTQSELNRINRALER